MSSLFQQPLNLRPQSASVEAARGVFDDDDLVLGWECANPALQIECWNQEATTGQAAAS